MTTDNDKLQHAREQGQAQFEHIKELLEKLESAELLRDDGSVFQKQWEDAEREIYEHPLSIEMRSGWYALADRDHDHEPAEFCILLCTGGPAVRLIGELNEHGEPEKCWLEVQDWFQPWTEFWPLNDGNLEEGTTTEAILLRYARCFYFGE